MPKIFGWDFVIVVLQVAGAGGVKYFDAKTQPWPLWTCVAVAGIGTVVSWYKARASRRSEFVEKLGNRAMSALVAASAQISDDSGVHPKDFALHAFIVYPRLFGEVQKRVARLRFVNNYHENNVDWRRGKGAVGMCWRDAAPVRFATADYPQLVAAQSEQEWDNIPRAERLGFTFQEWQRLRNYVGILAEPVCVGGKYVGCVTLDTGNDESFQHLDTAKSKNNLSYAARILAACHETL